MPTMEQAFIGLRGVIGVGSSFLAVLSPWQDQLSFAVGIICGLLTIVSLGITVFKQIKK